MSELQRGEGLGEEEIAELFRRAGIQAQVAEALDGLTEEEGRNLIVLALGVVIKRSLEKSDAQDVLLGKIVDLLDLHSQKIERLENRVG